MNWKLEGLNLNPALLRKTLLNAALLCCAVSLCISCTQKTGSAPLDAIRIGFIISTEEDMIRRNSWNLVDLLKRRFENGRWLVVADEIHPVAIVTKEIAGRNPEQAVRAAKELINQEGVAAIVGPHYSIDAIPAGEIAELAGIPLISPTGTHPRVTAGRSYVFRAGSLADFQAWTMASFAMTDLGLHNFAVLYNAANPYSRVHADAFRKTVLEGEGRIVAFETYVTGQSDFTAQLEKIKAYKPEAVYLPNFPDETESIVLQARDLGIGAILLGSNAWNGFTFSHIKQFNKAYMTLPASEDMLKRKPKVLFDEYLSRYGLELDNGTALTYDSFGVLFAAIRHAGSFEPGAIRDALYEMRPYKGVTGEIDYIDNGDPEREAVVLQFHEGSVKYYKSFSRELELKHQDRKYK